MELISKLDYNYIIKNEPLNPIIYDIFNNTLNEILSMPLTYEKSIYERLQIWLKNPRYIYIKTSGIIITLSIDNSVPVFILKTFDEDEYNTGKQLNILRYNNICPGVLYTYNKLENSILPVNLLDNKIMWINNYKYDMFLLEYIEGKTISDSYTNNEIDWYIIFLQLITTLWTINHHFKRIHFDLHSNNIIIRKLDNYEFILYKTPIGDKWIKTKYIPVIIDYEDFPIESTEGGMECIELISRILDESDILVSYDFKNKINKYEEVDISYRDIINLLNLSSYWTNIPQDTRSYSSYDELLNNLRPINTLEQMIYLNIYPNNILNNDIYPVSIINNLINNINNLINIIEISLYDDKYVINITTLVNYLNQLDLIIRQLNYINNKPWNYLIDYSKNIYNIYKDKYLEISNNITLNNKNIKEYSKNTNFIPYKGTSDQSYLVKMEINSYLSIINSII